MPNDSNSLIDSLVAQLASVFFTVDDKLRIKAPSSVLSRFLAEPIPENWSASFAELFDVVRPGKLSSFDQIVESMGSMVLLTTKSGNFAIRGQFIQMESGHSAIFIGAPWLSWMNTNQPDTQLMMDDFKAWDSQLDQMVLLSTERQNIEDLTNLTAELQLAREAAEKASAAQADFFAIMSHEMRTPLNGVVAALDIVVHDQLDEQNKKLLEISRISAENLKYVVDHVLDYSKLQVGGFDNEVKTLEIRKVVRSASRIIEARASANGNELISTVETQVPAYIDADAAKIRQVMINLLSNAAKFTRNGSIHLHVDITADDQLEVAVIDTGRGIPLELQPDIFNPFLTYNPDKEDSEMGTGLGLNISRRMVEIMDGTIDFQSTPGQGSRFYFRIPVTRSDAIEELDDADEKKYPSEFSGHLLLVEDNKTNQYLSRMILQGRGLTVDIADNGAQAIEMLDTRDYDIVFMDVSMPVMDGVTATRTLRQIPHLRDIPVVAMTAHADEASQERFLAAGMDGVITKPIDDRILNEYLLQFLEPSEEPDPGDELSSSDSNVEDDIVADNEIFKNSIAEQLLEDIGAESFSHLAALFEGEVNEGLVELKSAHACGDLDRVTRVAHSNQSTAASIGCEALARCLRVIEDKARADTGESIDGLVADYLEIVPQSLLALEQFTLALPTD